MHNDSPGHTLRFPLSLVNAVLIGLLATLGLVSGATSASTAPCSATYTILKQSQKHFRAAIHVTSNGDTVEAWTVQFDLPQGQQVHRSWNGSFTQSGQTVTITDSGSALASGQSVTPQFTARRRGGPVGQPTATRLNGQLCDDGSTPTTSQPTTTETTTTTTAPTTTSTTEATSTTGVETTTTTTTGGSSAEGNLALIKANRARNTQFDNNPFRDVPMSDIPLSGLTVNGDIYNEGLLDTSHSGYFRVKCEVSHFAYDDPLVYPNQPGRAHLHMFFGNTDTNAYSTFDSLLNTGTGTCNGEDLNRSAYWIPAVLDSNGNALIPFELMVYYKNENFRYGGANELVGPFPDKLRMIVGRGGATSPQADLTGGPNSLPVIGFACGPAYNSNDKFQPLIPDCDGTGAGPYDGRALEMRIAFPQCYNPTEDTYFTDGSHMSYSEGGYYGIRCPDSHPYDVSSIMYRIFFDPDDYGGSLRNLHLSSDIKHDQILPGGTTAHADWFGAWHPEAMQMWVDNCNNTQADCEIGLLNRNPALSMVDRKKGFYPNGYRAKAEDLIQLCPGKTLDLNDRLRSVASCHHG